MEDKLILPSTAKLAKEKGFKWKTMYYVGIKTSGQIDPHICSMTPISDWNSRETLISLPTQSFLQKWLREVHDIDITPPLRFYDGYRCSIIRSKRSKTFPSYELALEEELYLALKTIP